jgi:hypothetical protein
LFFTESKKKRRERSAFGYTKILKKIRKSSSEDFYMAQFLSFLEFDVDRAAKI